MHKATALAAALLTLMACDPVEDRLELTNSFRPDEVKLEAVQTAGGNGNGITLKMTTPGVTGYWDYKIGKKYTDRVEFVFPYTGEVTFTYHITSYYIDGALKDVRHEDITKDITLTVGQMDQAIADPYYALVGDNLEGKTWVLDTERAAGWWFMSAPNKLEGCMEAWWDAGNQSASEGWAPADYLGKMTFDLTGGANFTHYASRDGAPSKVGSFGFNADFTKLIINGEQKILCNTSDRGNPNGEYLIYKLTKDEMVLYNPVTSGGDSGWTWVFKPLRSSNAPV